jgi:hypothetical protein
MPTSNQLTFLTLQFLHAACARSFDKSTLSFSAVCTVDGRFFLIGIDMNLDGGGENPSILISVFVIRVCGRVVVR